MAKILKYGIARKDYPDRESYFRAYQAARKIALGGKTEGSKEANRLYMRRWRKEHSEEARARRGARSPGARVRQKTRARVRTLALSQEIKLEQGCIDCGYREHPEALEFDHVRGDKKFAPAAATSKKALLEEIEKCVVRCANCHRVATARRRAGLPDWSV